MDFTNVEATRRSPTIRAWTGASNLVPLSWRAPQSHNESICETTLVCEQPSRFGIPPKSLVAVLPASARAPNAIEGQAAQATTSSRSTSLRRQRTFADNRIQIVGGVVAAGASSAARPFIAKCVWDAYPTKRPSTTTSGLCMASPSADASRGAVVDAQASQMTSKFKHGSRICRAAPPQLPHDLRTMNASAEAAHMRQSHEPCWATGKNLDQSKMPV